MEDGRVEQDEVNRDADDIAAAITNILIKAFVSKEKREPTNEEIQMLLEELTEERVESMLNGGDGEAVADEAVEDNDSVESDTEDSNESNKDIEDQPKCVESDSVSASIGSKRLVSEKEDCNENDSPNGDKIIKKSKIGW